jgi:hypothetical protein
MDRVGGKEPFTEGRQDLAQLAGSGQIIPLLAVGRKATQAPDLRMGPPALPCFETVAAGWVNLKLQYLHVHMARVSRR